jgi:NAD(P)-dependent dehydrogenase (short-subunit alcohol dehydrogenase family)
LAVRNVTVVVLDVKPIVTENCAYLPELTTVAFADQFPDNITYYKCDVSKLEEVEAVAKKVIEEVCHNTPFGAHRIDRILQLGHPTVLVNNAGVVQGKLILDLSPEDIRQSVSLFIAR